MPRAIKETDRHARSQGAQTAMILADEWYRVDKGDGAVTPVEGPAVLRAARGAFRSPNHALATGRFQTTFAIYSRGEQLTEAERPGVHA